MKIIPVLLLLSVAYARKSIPEHVREISETFFNKTLSQEEFDHVHFLAKDLGLTEREPTPRVLPCPDSWAVTPSKRTEGDGYGSCSCDTPCRNEWRASWLESIKGQRHTVTYTGSDGNAITESSCVCRHCGILGVFKPASLTASILGLVNTLIQPVFSYMAGCVCGRNFPPGSDARTKCGALASCASATVNTVTTNTGVWDLFALAWKSSFGTYDDEERPGWRGALAVVSKLKSFFITYLWTCFSWKFAKTWGDEAAAIGNVAVAIVDLNGQAHPALEGMDPSDFKDFGNSDPFGLLNVTGVNSELGELVSKIIYGMGTAAIGAFVDFIIGIVWKFAAIALSGPAASVVAVGLFGKFVYECREPIVAAGRAAFNILNSLVTCNGGGTTFEGLVAVFVNLATCKLLEPCRKSNKYKDIRYQAGQIGDLQYIAPESYDKSGPAGGYGQYLVEDSRKILQQCDSELCEAVLGGLETLDSLRK